MLVFWSTLATQREIIMEEQENVRNSETDTVYENDESSLFFQQVMLNQFLG